MSITTEIEEKLGIKIETLNKIEEETYKGMLESVQKSQLTLEKLRESIVTMRNAVTKELVNEPEFIRIFIFKFENRKQILLKARLQNYMLIESFLLSPERAKEALENMISGMVKR